MEVEPHTEPLPPLGAFASTQYRFTTGVRAGETATIRGANDQVLLTYRSFASIVGVIAAFLVAIVAAAGAAGVLLLVYQGAPLRAVIAAVLTVAFALLIAMLVPRVEVTLFEENRPALTISQRKVFPSATYVVTTPNGAQLAELRKSVLSRLGRNKWTIAHDGRYLGEAREDSFTGAVLRKLLGKFSRKFETNVVLSYGGVEVGRIQRRSGDVLELTSDTMDRRVAVALATMVLGREP
ncbi:MAG TPA: hypothetical protein VF432_22685 [Thermoanaerobaculia bacterium]